ncbi:MAG: alpha/beta hydrolase [Pedobacter sp.]|nr:MAG: alpha/beta hydrolase [Pedobacter sp.]
MKHPFSLLLLCTLFYCHGFTQKNEMLQAEARPFILGHITEINSKELNEKRTLNIYLPEGYNAKDSIRYPVVYLLDGSADEDFIHIVGLYQFNNFPWIDLVPKSIIVGIANTDRKRDFTYPTSIALDKKELPTSGGSKSFIAFLEKELQPFIQSRYQTNTSKTIIGQSLGGLLATEILLKKPTLFTQYIIISPSLWWDNGSLLALSSNLLTDGFAQETEVYIGVGKEGLTPGQTNRVMEVDANLLAEKLKVAKSKNVHIHFDYLPAEDHATVTHQAVFNALRLMNPDKRSGE